jgi:two-component system, NarL family, sensor histidine kinase DevS
LRALLEAAHGFASSLTLEEILDRVLALARELTDARYAAVGVLSDARDELAQFRVSGLDSSTSAAIGDPPRGRGVLGLLITDPRPLRLASVGLHPLSYGFPPGHPAMTSFLGAPIVIDGVVWGNLYLTEKSARSGFTDVDEEIAVVLAAWAAVAVATSRRVTDIEQQRTELREKVAALEAAETAASALGDAPDLSQALGLLMKRGRDLIEARSLICIRFGREKPVLVASAGEGSQPVRRRLPAGAAKALQSAAECPDDRYVLDAVRVVMAGTGIGELESALVAAVARGGSAVGVLVACDRREPGTRFAARDRVLLRAFAASAATAVALRLHDVQCPGP